MGGILFNTVPELINELNNMENSRCPLTIIHTSDIETWSEITSNLNKIVDEVVLLSEYCNGEDYYPNMGDIHTHVERLIKQNKKIMIIPVSEIIRDGNIKYILPFREETCYKSKIYLPLFGLPKDIIKDINDNDDNNTNERKISIYEHKLNVDIDCCIDVYTISSDNFNEINQIYNILSKNKTLTVKSGIKEYLKLWESNEISNPIILCSYFFDDAIEGIVNIQPLENIKEINDIMYVHDSEHLLIKYNLIIFFRARF